MARYNLGSASLLLTGLITRRVSITVRLGGKVLLQIERMFVSTTIIFMGSLDFYNEPHKTNERTNLGVSSRRGAIRNFCIIIRQSVGFVFQHRFFNQSKLAPNICQFVIIRLRPLYGFIHLLIARFTADGKQPFYTCNKLYSNSNGSSDNVYFYCFQFFMGVLRSRVNVLLQKLGATIKTLLSGRSNEPQTPLSHINAVLSNLWLLLVLVFFVGNDGA